MIQTERAPVDSEKKPFQGRRHLLHDVLHWVVELTNSALLALDVLAERTQRAELRAAPVPRLRAPINLVIMGRTAEVLVEPIESLVLSMAQEAFIVLAVERQRRRDGDHRWLWHGVAVWPRDEARRVRDDVRPVVVDCELVDALTRQLRRAHAGLEVQQQPGTRYEPLGALAARARQGSVSVCGRLQVCLQVLLTLEVPRTLDTAVVLVCAMLI